MTCTRVPIEVGQVWEARTKRRDGTRERVTVVELDGRAAVVESENPRPPLKARRRVGILLNEINASANLGNMRLVETPDGGRVTWPPEQGMRITYGGGL